MDRTDWRDIRWPEWIAGPVTWLNSVDSTNSYLASLVRAKDLPEGAMVIAETQTRGRGKRDRTWFSPPGGSIYVSILLRPGFLPAYAHLPTLMMAAAAAGAIQHRFQIQARVKWPNDIQIEGLKIGGILTEAVLRGTRIDYLILGLGLNCNIPAEAWPGDLGSKAASLCDWVNGPVDRGDLLAQILDIFGRDYRLALEGDFDSAVRGWRSLNDTLGRLVRILTPSGPAEGVAEGLLTDGALVLRNPSTGTHREIRLGEVI